MKLADKSRDVIEAQATAWLARCDSGMSDAEKAEFDRWCAADPSHAAAVKEIAALWAAFDRPAASGQIESLRDELDALDRRDRRRWMAGGAAAALGAAACLAVFFGLQRPPAPQSMADAVAVSAARVVEPERRILPDGSIIDLKHGARIAVVFSDESRVVVLEQGEAHFSVTKDPQRPFIVETAAVAVSAVGTAFAVGLGQNEIEVLVTEGRVRIDSTPPASAARSDLPRNNSPVMFDAAPAPMVVAGQRAVIMVGSAAFNPTVGSVSEAELTERLSWRLPRLEFSETSVAEAIGMFNRHNQLRLRTIDEAVAAMRITGIFRSDNVEGFVRALEVGLGLRVERRDRELILHRAK